MITSYYAPPESVRGDWLELPEEEAHHAVRVLRQRPGDEIVVVDGEGGWYRVRLELADKRSAAGQVVERRQEVGEPPYELTVGMALLKNPNRFETFLEKAVELGVHTVVPLVTARTEKGRIKDNRAHKILVAAMKQCGRSRLLHLAEPQSLDAFLEAHAGDRLFICHEQVEEGSLLDALSGSDAVRLSVLVGPEGGFTEEEVAAAVAAGAAPVSLGPRRLRAETAALTAAAAVLLARPR